MGYLRGLQEYLKENYSKDFFDEFYETGEPLILHLHGPRILKGKIVENLSFDLKIRDEASQVQQIPKIEIKFYYPRALEEKVKPKIGNNEKIRALNFKPILKPDKRFHIKNKTLYPMMMLRQPIILTLLEGEILKGLIRDFTIFEILLEIENNVVVHVLRHSVYRCEDENKRNLLKSFQDRVKDYRKTPLWVE